MKKFLYCLMIAELSAHAADPVVTNVQATQRVDSKLVSIRYSVSDADGDKVDVSLKVTDGDIEIPATSLVGDVGENIRCGKNKYIEWDAGADWNGHISSNVVFEVTVDDGTTPSVPSDMVLIPGGTNAGTDPDFGAYSLTVSTFYMDRTEVTKAQWDTVYNWAISHGYSFDHAGSGKASNHPVHTVSWYDCVKWCNARSQMEGRTPCYNLSDWSCNFSAGGYRLPTTAEWEYAARGGLSGKRFPWGDTINHNYSNYRANGSAYSYDTSPYTTYTYHPSYDDGGYPYTSPAGSFAANGYELYDMSGNVWEWCNDASGSFRYVRGGSWNNLAFHARCGNANWDFLGNANRSVGFRSVCR